MGGRLKPLQTIAQLCSEGFQGYYWAPHDTKSTVVRLIDSHISQDGKKTNRKVGELILM